MTKHNLNQHFDTLNKSEVAYWSRQAECLDWFKPFGEVYKGDWSKGEGRWYDKGQLNACFNALDRHLDRRGDQLAIIWEGDDPSHVRKITYRQLHEQVCQLANLLKQRGVCPGDRVCLYMPMLPEAVISMLACARIGAVHSVVFGGFSANALKNRIDSSGACCVITADGFHRGGHALALKDKVDEALVDLGDVHTVVVVENTGQNMNMLSPRDISYAHSIAGLSKECPCVWVDAQHPLFILYTSGSTGQPKGVVHATAGYLVYATTTFQAVFSIQAEDVYFCTADVGWITGHSYVTYAPLISGITVLMHEGLPSYPSINRYGEMIDRYGVTVFYTSPTAIRVLMKEGDAALKHTQRTSLRILGSVGEPISPDAWHWYRQEFGRGACPIMDTWWQTETGGFMIAPVCEGQAQKPGAAMCPMQGIAPVLLNQGGHEIQGSGEGVLAIKQPWPGLMSSIDQDQARFVETYLKPYPGYYYTGDGAYRDNEGHYWITGRVDDVITISGHRLGTSEVESALALHADVVEAAVVGMPDALKGEVLYAFVVLKPMCMPTTHLVADLKRLVREEIGPIAIVGHMRLVNDLPKTRSGKIMRRILRKIVAGEVNSLGDLSTIANPQVIEDLVGV